MQALPDIEEKEQLEPVRSFPVPNGTKEIIIDASAGENLKVVELEFYDGPTSIIEDGKYSSHIETTKATCLLKTDVVGKTLIKINKRFKGKIIFRGGPKMPRFLIPRAPFLGTNRDRFVEFLSRPKDKDKEKNSIPRLNNFFTTMSGYVFSGKCNIEIGELGDNIFIKDGGILDLKQPSKGRFVFLKDCEEINSETLDGLFAYGNASRVFYGEKSKEGTFSQDYFFCVNGILLKGGKMKKCPLTKEKFHIEAKKFYQDNKQKVESALTWLAFMYVASQKTKEIVDSYTGKKTKDRRLLNIKTYEKEFLKDLSLLVEGESLDPERVLEHCLI